MFNALANLFRSPSRRRKATMITSDVSAIVQPLESREMMSANPVHDWNDILLDTVRDLKPAPPIAARALAIVSTAVFDAVNSIDGRYEAYWTTANVSPLASKEAAVAAAAHRTLSQLFPSRQAVFDAQYFSTVSMVPFGPMRDAGIGAGQFVADRLLSLRSIDGADRTVNYTIRDVPGEWNPTAPTFAPPVLPQWPLVTPWAMSRGNQFRPTSPPPLTSAVYAANLNEVKKVGAANSRIRTADQTSIAYFWAGGQGTATPPGQWNMIAQTVAEQQGLSIVHSARMYALLNIAMADAAIVSWDAKYSYNLWRPIDAIQNADLDANRGTIRDPFWTPLLTTPAFPAYTSGHSTFSSAAAAVLGDFFGSDDITFVAQSEIAGVASRFYTSFRSAAAEAGLSRIFGGIHFQFDNAAGLSSGDALGRFVVANCLPLRAGAQLVNGNLLVSGTSRNDSIRLETFGSWIDVTVNNRLLLSVPGRSVCCISVECGAGNDCVTVSSWIYIATTIRGDAGNDCLYGGSGADTLLGGSGHDQLFGNWGDDSLFGGDGDDLLDGNGGSNYLNSGSGFDTLYVNWFFDIFNTGPGRKRIFYR